MRIIVSDTSCMIHLEKATLLNAVLALPYTFVMPDTLFEHEWLGLAESDKKMLCDNGLEVRGLPGAAVTRAAAHFNRHKPLTLNDCFALALAQDIDDSILLTGDSALRTVAERNGIEVHGILWVTDELESHGIASPLKLHDALQLLHDDPLVFLPDDEVLRRIRHLARLL